MTRTFVIGDIHGAYKALHQLIQRISPTKNDVLIFLGDYVDGWSESAKVISYLLELDQTYTCIFIKGNHDAWCEEWLATGEADNEWLFHGGKQTIASYQGIDPHEREQHIKFFKRLKNYYADEQNRLFIHAGFSSMHGPEKERYETNFLWDRTLWELALAMDNRIKTDSKLYPKRLLLYSEVFIGHTPTLNYGVMLPMNSCNVWNIDTGAAFYGSLSAIDADSKQIWQSDIVQTLYPGEKGRNK